MSLLGSIPLLGLIIVAYNVIVFTGGAQGIDTFLQKTVLDIPMVKGVWTLRVSDATLALALFALFGEILRATGIGRVAIMNHALSVGVFVIAIVEFLVLDGFATSVFFLITLMALIDVIGGFTIGIISARRDIGLSGRVLDQV